MKFWLSAALALTLALAACQKKDEGSPAPPAPAVAPPPPPPQTFAATPQPCNAQQVTANCFQYPGQVLPGQWPAGAWYWPQQWQPNHGNCGCPNGYAPVMQGGSMACAPFQYFVQPAVVYFNWGYTNTPAQNPQWNNIPQNQYNANTTAAQCFQQTAQGCDVRTPSHCPSGTVCQPISGGSTLGLCVRGP